MAKGFGARDYNCTPTGVEFETESSWLKEIFDRCEHYCIQNQARFSDKQVLREGSDYDGVWLETQPMAGEMYAKRNMEVALNNQLIFMENQRRSGRFPGMIKYSDPFLLQVSYDWLQGYCFPVPALRMYYLIGKDRGYLELLYKALRDFDNYLWTYRDSDGDGCLETWCTWDTGEDNCTRFLKNGVTDGGWGGEEPPCGKGKLPYESMDIMSYSYQGREVLARISALLHNGEEAEWRAKAEQIRTKIHYYLWDDEKHACFDRDCDNKPMYVMTHNNLRCMYFGSFTQQMADDFIKFHLLNPEEFWTYLPLPSIAANDPYFCNSNFNNWSGQSMGLTYQRAIDALENYGHCAEIRMLGKKWLKNLKKHRKLVQQYDPFDGTPCVTRAEGGAPEDEQQRFGDVASVDPEGYGPTIISALEYISLLAGVNIAMEQVKWTVVLGMLPSSYTQHLLGRRYTLVQNGTIMSAFIDHEEIFRCSCGVQVLTDMNGNVLEICGVEEKSIHIELTCNGVTTACELATNEFKVLRQGKLHTARKVRFDYPFQSAV